MLLADTEIREYAERGMIVGGVMEKVSQDKDGNEIRSYGLEATTYTMRLGCEFQIRLSMEQYKGFAPSYAVYSLDPKESNAHWFSSVSLRPDLDEQIYVAADGMLLCHSVEWFSLPNDITAEVKLKSSYARLGLLLSDAWFDPGWQGNATLCLVNPNPVPVYLYTGEGVAAMAFHKHAPVENGYQGKYQGSTGAVVG